MTVITCSRRGAQLVNELSVEVFFRQRRKKALAELPTDWETNSENYDKRGQLKKDGPPEPTPLEIFEGQRLFLTKNMNKETGFVNGMACVVEAHSGCLEVLTKTGARLAVPAIHEHVVGPGPDVGARDHLARRGGLQGRGLRCPIQGSARRRLPRRRRREPQVFHASHVESIACRAVG